ncbi:VHL beta domain-containing protein [Undibacterium terreum]|uniref:von Hippel-Lindau disease tumour suppressor beta domain-containing protein n=1 Tax=Undibacterium terreum TaxID=1224302 RepID=A0A916U7V9_9BURK|nr:hypothetical protein [Undibacterium terreum]GGC63909.1 hypothetical protein GCM10011396_08590 [Undibacterium terreum]
MIAKPSSHLRSLLAGVGLAVAAAAPAQAQRVSAPPAPLVAKLHLSSVYAKYTDVGGFPVVATAKVSDHAVAEAAYLIYHMVGRRPDILRAIADKNIRFVVMAPSEMTTDVPEHSDLAPKSYWDRRARGIGATPPHPATSAGEENLLNLPGDPYPDENILIHEFAHTVYEAGMVTLDPSFDRRLLAAYEHARATGLWKGTYAMTNRTEYWASAAQSWFDCARGQDEDHNDIRTRAQLKAYDPAIAALLKEAFGDGKWRYAKPASRPAGERRHLAGFDIAKAGSFSWPAQIAANEIPDLGLGATSDKNTPSASPRNSSGPSGIFFINHLPAVVSIDWLDFDGKPVHYADIKPGEQFFQSTYVGHVWKVSAAGQVQGTFVAQEGNGRVEINAKQPQW